MPVIGFVDLDRRFRDRTDAELEHSELEDAETFASLDGLGLGWGLAGAWLGLGWGLAGAWLGLGWGLAGAWLGLGWGLAGAWLGLGSSIGWTALLEHARVVLLAEAGAGKT